MLIIIQSGQINLKQGFVSKKSRYNNVNYNIQLLGPSDYPDKELGNVIIAGHSGSARISYFRNLDRLEMGDEAYIIYNGKTYTYKVVNIYDIEKTGKAEIVKEKNTSTLTLITCRHNTNKQIIIILNLI